MIIEDLTEEETENMCKMGEDLILGCKRMTIHFICEGSKCDEAFEMYQEEY